MKQNIIFVIVIFWGGFIFSACNANNNDLEESTVELKMVNTNYEVKIGRLNPADTIATTIYWKGNDSSSYTLVLSNDENGTTVSLPDDSIKYQSDHIKALALKEQQIVETLNVMEIGAKRSVDLLLTVTDERTNEKAVANINVGSAYSISTSDMHIRDPFITVDREHQCYYLITSAWKDSRGALFAYKSEDLDYWKEIGYVFQATADYLGTDDYWAPDTYEYNGNYYSFVTMSNSAKGILRGTTVLRSTSGIIGQYSPVLLSDRLNMTPVNMQCLDGSLFVEDDGTPWMIFSVEWNGPNVTNKVGEIWAQKLNNTLTDTIGDPHFLFDASEASWVDRYSGGLITDAPFIWKDKTSGNLLLLWSSFSPLYSIGQAISTNGSVLGPWTQEPTPVFSNNGGHQMVFKDLNGNLKISFHSPNESTDTRKTTVTIRDISIKDGKFEPLN